MVKALESQAKSFSEYLDFLKSRTSKHNLTAAEQLEDTLGLESDLLATSTRHLLETSNKPPAGAEQVDPRAASTRQTRIPRHGKDTTVPQIFSIRMDICLEIYEMYFMAYF